MDLYGKVLAILQDGSAEAQAMARQLGVPWGEVLAVLEALAAFDLVGAEPPPPCGREYMRWWIMPSRREKALALIAPPPAPWPFFEVSVDGYAPYVTTGRTQGKAYYSAYQAYAECRRVSFHDWLCISRIRRLDGGLPAWMDDGYDYVRAYYGVEPRIGERRILVSEGTSSGRAVTVLYPNRSTTSMLHVAYEGDGRSMLVHPRNALTLAGARWKAWLEAQRAA